MEFCLLLLDYDEDDNPIIEEIHHMPPLFVFPRKYVNTAMAQSQLDVENKLPDNRVKAFGSSSKKMKNRPPGFGPPTAFERYVAASKSGNVNSVMMLNFMKGKVIPWIRHGMSTKDSFLVKWDRHASHESLPIFDLLKTEKGWLVSFLRIVPIPFSIVTQGIDLSRS